MGNESSFKIHQYCTIGFRGTLKHLMVFYFFSSQDTEAWTKLCERLSEKCFIIGEHVYPRAERFVNEGFGGLASSGVSLRMRQLTTVTDLIKAASLIKGKTRKYSQPHNKN